MTRWFFLSWLLWTVPSMAQDNWANRVGAWSNDAYNDLVRDAAGNLYVTGEFGGSIALGGQTVVSMGSLDAVVAKYSASGALLWVRSFGGPGLDRGAALALGPGGQLAVTGAFMGTVDFGGTVISSQGGTMDMFVARLSPSTGEVLWARSGGGADGVDQPNGVSVGADGQVVVTGEFRGTADFGTGAITSTTDPDAELPSVDIFVAAYSADGDPQWTKHGAAKYADRGMAVAHDPAGNVYVTGQFSDTLTFEHTHPNQMYGAVFLVRFGPGGEEQWLRIFGGGTYNQVFALQVVDGTHLMLAGDLQGTVIFLDSQPDLFTAAAPRSSFLVEVDFEGEFIRQHTWGSDHVVNTRAFSVSDTEIAVFGRFQCQFTGFSALHGEGTWLATGQHDLYIARFQRSDLSLIGAQQFGGLGNKGVGGIVHDAGGQLYFSGSFHHVLVFPSNEGTFSMSHSVNNLVVPVTATDYCGDPHYGKYRGLRGTALMDAFIAKGWVDGREPYDMFRREVDDGCLRPQRDVRIRKGNQGETGADSLSHCGEALLVADTRTAFHPDTAVRHTAPKLEFLWNTGATTRTITTEITGWYHVTVTSAAGCWQRVDSLHLTVHPIPPKPLMNDDVVVNTNALNPGNIVVCVPAEPWLWATNVDPDHALSWWYQGVETPGDSVQAFASGNYVVVVTTPEGCENSNSVNVQLLPNEPLPPLEPQYNVLFPQAIPGTDTVLLCMNQPLLYGDDVTLWLDSGQVSLPYGIRQLRNCNNVGWTPQSPPGQLSAWCTTTIPEDGWYSFDVGVALTNAPCGEDTLFFWRTDSVYVLLLPVPVPGLHLSGPPFICPGDTVTLAATCNDCSTMNWSGPGIVANYGDSIDVVSAGWFTVHMSVTDPNGCAVSTSAQHQLPWNIKPQLAVLPPDGIICPDSLALILSDTQGTDYQWYGPWGPLEVDHYILETEEPGLYYISLVDTFGCHLTSDPVLVTQYATPYLNVLPSNVLCEPGETATLQVVTTGASTLQWAAPLWGNALEQVVSQPGIYSCTVQSCNIITVLSVEIVGNNAQAVLEEEGPYILCEGEVLVLEAGGGNPFHYWMPGEVFGPSLPVTTPGHYQLVAMDANGCQDTLGIFVGFHGWQIPLSVLDTTICAGTPLVLEVAGSGVLSWFADGDMQQLLGQGDQLDVGAPVADLSVYVMQEEGPCSSSLQQLSVTVLPLPQGDLIVAPDEVCLDAPFEMALTGGDADGALWTTPQGSLQGLSFAVAAAGVEHAGAYVVVPYLGPCAGTPIATTLIVLIPMPPDMGPDTTFCEGGHTHLHVPPGYTDPWWSTGSDAPMIVITEAGWYGLSAIDPQGCPAFAEVLLTTEPCDIDIPNIITPNGDGINDDWWLGPGDWTGALMQVHNRMGNRVWQGDPTRVRFKGLHDSGEPLSEGVYYYVISVRLTDGGQREQQGYIHIQR